MRPDRFGDLLAERFYSSADERQCGPEAAAAGSFSSCSWACGIRFCVVIGHSYVCYSIMPFGQFDSDPNFQSVCSP